MKKIIRLTESDLTRIVRRVIKEQDEKDMIDIPKEYNFARMELGNSASTEDIINMYNELVEWRPPLVNYSDHGTEGMFYNEEGDEMSIYLVLDELNFAIVGSEYEDDDDYQDMIDIPKGIDIPKKYGAVNNELGNFASFKEIINKYNDIVDKGNTLRWYLVKYSDGVFYNQVEREIPVDELLSELNSAILFLNEY